MTTLPLSHVRILDLTNVIAGPMATRVLAHLGAQVIKVEPPWGRAVGRILAFRPEAGRGRPYNAIPSFNEVNRAKLSASLDLRRTEGKQLFQALLAISDVVVENYSPRVMPNLGLAYEALRQVRPDLIMVSMPAMGAGDLGPWANYISFGPGTDALAGLSDLTGYEGGPPSKPGNFYADQNSASHVAFAVMVALRHRRRTGQGQHIQVVLRETTMAVIGECFLEYQMTGGVPTRIGNRHSWMAPHNVYPCAGEDSWVAIAVASDAEFQRLSQAIERPELAQDPRFADGASRKRNERELDPCIEAWTRSRTRQEAMLALQRHGVRAGAVLTVGDLKTDSHWAALGSTDAVDHPEAGHGVHPGLPWRASRSGGQLGRPAPLFAEHNAFVLGDLLGLPEEDMLRLQQAGAAPTEPMAL
ncbi:MAG: CoA transferase [Chloroflexi bacterium]|nr:CoA transferase [Chloroflexota bacterium]